MASPIKPSSSTGSNGSSAISPALNDLMNRLSTQGGSFDNENSMQAFSSWLQKHALTGDGAKSEQQAQAKPEASESKAADSQTSASREAQQALARARQQATANNKALNKSSDDDVQQTQSVQQQDKSAPTQAKSSGKTSTAKTSTDKSSKSTDDDKKDDGEVAFNTSSGDGSAVVRELTPPPSIQPGDAAGMMAWLAGLTNGDLSHAGGKTEDLKPTDTNATQGLSTDANADLTGKMADLLQAGKHGAHDAQAGLALDPALWQAANGSTQQADTLLSQFNRGSGQGEGDAIAGLMSGGALKGATFNDLMSGNTQSVRHETATLDAPFGSTDFAQALAEKVSMWVGSAKTDGAMTAELHLNPADMGPINVKISLDGQSAHVDFAAAALETRQAIEASLPMLSSALNDIGLSLTGGGVSSQTSQQSFAQAQDQARNGSTTGGSRSEDGDAGVEGLRAVSAPRPGRAGGLDLYA